MMALFFSKSKYFIAVLAVPIFLFISLKLHGGTNVPFSRGFNLTSWFQVSSPQQIQFSKYTKQDFENIKSLGCDVIRLPINLHYMTNGEPDYTLDPLFLTFIDEVVSWAEGLEMHLILDNHTFSVEDDTDPGVGDILEKVWVQMATHYLNASSLIYYEVLNEPHGIADNTWNTIQQGVVEAIRQIDQVHTIIVGPASWNSYSNLQSMPEYDDDNLIYTFHFYDPFLFTHQGASWTYTEPFSSIPFPYNEEKMPVCPAAVKGTWIENSFNNYSNEGTVEKVHELIDIAVAFQQERNVPLYCGELGVYDLVSPDDDRTYWYGVVANYLEEKGIAWTIWDYHGSFGIFNKNGNGMFEHDLNVGIAEVLGLTYPEQTPFIAQPDTAGFGIFTDYIGQNINNASYGDGSLSFYSEYQPNNGAYCIQWSGASQYQSIVFDFAPNKDFSRLLEENYALGLIIRGTDTEGSLDIRFVDSKENDDDHPWRMRITVDKKIVEWDGQWQELYIPLGDFTEHGSWDNNTWYSPQGLFDWTAIDKLEIVTESQGMSGDGIFWIDNIFITNQDTAKTKDYSEIEIFPERPSIATFKFICSDELLQMQNNSEGTILFRLTDLLGRTFSSGSFDNSYSINTSNFRKGIYLLQFSNDKNQRTTEKILLH